MKKSFTFFAIMFVLKANAQLVCFNSAINFTTGTNPVSVCTADFNGDGNADVVVANQSINKVSLLLGNGTGSFGTATGFTVGTNPSAVISRDFNNDGKADL